MPPPSHSPGTTKYMWLFAMRVYLEKQNHRFGRGGAGEGEGGKKGGKEKGRTKRRKKKEAVAAATVNFFSFHLDQKAY